jgi:hypothetical protein
VIYPPKKNDFKSLVNTNKHIIYLKWAIQNRKILLSYSSAAKTKTNLGIARTLCLN